MPRLAKFFLLLSLLSLAFIVGLKVGDSKQLSQPRVFFSGSKEVQDSASTSADKLKSTSISRGGGKSVQIRPEDAFLGDADAKLAIIEYADFQCPFCGRFFQEIEPLLKKEYIDTGKAKFVFKNSALLGKESVDAAIAALCAKEQNKFWEYHGKLYQNQMGENQGAFAIPILKRLAGELGLAIDQFDSCLDQEKYSAQVQSDTEEIKAMGYTTTPTTFIGETAIVGAQPYATFKTVIDEKLTAL